jgi:hypothetical protein
MSNRCDLCPFNRCNDDPTEMYRVIGADGRDWGNYHYCLSAAEKDRERGLVLLTQEEYNLRENPETILGVSPHTAHNRSKYP